MTDHEQPEPDDRLTRIFIGALCFIPAIILSTVERMWRRVRR